MKIEWKSCFRVGISAFLLYLCVTYWHSFSGFAGTLLGASMPLLIGCVVAYVINILISFYEKHYFPKTKKARFEQKPQTNLYASGVPYACNNCNSVSSAGRA